MSANAKFSTLQKGKLLCALCLAQILTSPAYAKETYEHLPWVDPDASQYHEEQYKLEGNDQAAVLGRVERYLNGVKTIKANFMQHDQAGGVADGVFYLERPGKMRWQYNPPVPVLMVTKGDVLIYVDFELEQVTHIPLSSTIAGIIAKENIRFDEDVEVLDVRAGANNIRVALSKKGAADEGFIVLELEEKPMRLTRMVVGDATGQLTRIDLSEAEYNLTLDKSLFTFKDPRGPNKRRIKN